MRTRIATLVAALLVASPSLFAQSTPRPASGERPAPQAPPAPAAVSSIDPAESAVTLLGRASQWERFDFAQLTGAFSSTLRSAERHPQDPADSAYREARSLLNRGEWRKSAGLFAQIAQRQPASAYASDALYWQAFALYRIGGISELREAFAALETRKTRFPRANNADEAAVLATRVEGALAARGDAAASARVRSAAPASASGCDSEEISVRSSALNVLARNDPEAAAPLLLKVLERRDDCSVSLRKNAVMMIGTKGDAAATARLAQVAKSDPDPDVRSDAIEYLAKAPGDEIVATLEALVQSDSAVSVQRAAVRALGAHESPRARAAIRALVERSAAPERLRLEAISTFDRGASNNYYSCDNCGSFGGQFGVPALAMPPTPPIAPVAPRAPRVARAPVAEDAFPPVAIAARATIPPVDGSAALALIRARMSADNEDRRIAPDDAAWLRGVYPRLETTRLKSRAVAVLARSSDEPTLLWLMALVQREEEQADVRATVLSRLGRDLPIAQLNKLYDSAADRTVRQQIVSVLGDRKEPEATDKLIEIVRTGTDPQLRRSAISALNDKKDPRTTKLLLELIDR